LLDEPFSGMDDNNRELIVNMIESHISNKGMVVLSTHEKGRILNIKNTKELVIE
jgi:ABC-type transport system involved in cytochrome c biogenesis ATPase subunit